ncbi:hypothetical protein [Virgibacillus pantothenticus]|uniref:hypothetical protein n=1 Tax=Virgibacillus pantothenticus TaxID=1473 RepID=UPI001C2487F8|nr:hypothetical protein [Virgibacillus pantothenticus]MEB5469661.1 hypothetical protein [Virgibacillus pantothenticus]
MAKVHVIHVVDNSGRMHFTEQVDNMISFELQKFGETLFARYEQITKLPLHFCKNVLTHLSPQIFK